MILLTKLLVDCLIKQGVEFVFSFSEAKNNPAFEALIESPIKPDLLQ